MRIEQGIATPINRIDHHTDRTKPMEMFPEQKTGDRVELSLSKSRIDTLPGVRMGRLEEVRARLKSGFYDRPDVREGIADAFLRQNIN